MGKLLALDVGARRIGVAEADELLRIAHPVTTVIVDGHEIEKLTALVNESRPDKIVVGFPRNQSGEPTSQTTTVETFTKRLNALNTPVVFQDESLTSVIAEQRLQERKKAYTKEMIDAEAATLILEDYLEANYGH